MGFTSIPPYRVNRSRYDSFLILYTKKGKVCVNGVTEELFPERLAKRVSLSPFYFSRRFKQETGYTPYHYIYTSRIHLAQFYLKTSEDTVKEIGYRCGFKSEHSDRIHTVSLYLYFAYSSCPVLSENIRRHGKRNRLQVWV